jgi:hypothetical protein
VLHVSVDTGAYRIEAEDAKNLLFPLLPEVRG